MGFTCYSRHYDLNSNLAAALMSRYELILAANSTSHLVMLDGSVSSAILANNLAAHARFTTPLTVEFGRNLYEFHLAARTILVGREDNRIYVACPKATEKQEICYEMEWERAYPDLISSINEKELLNQLPILLYEADFHAKRQIDSATRVYKTRLKWQNYRTDQEEGVSRDA